ncbi:MAG: D-hexose-6-phosphate mutarotase [Candidatus Obscuribacterales bacterium]|nr:D-hexose-6-phosphate mutarotase [Candidatus Obscuribacterales bacterium]
MPPIIKQGELEKIQIKNQACSAELFLQGAHLTAWQPLNEKPVLFLSKNSAFQKGKAIRGGVPLIAPWFGARSTNPLDERTDGPSHGFARTSLWQLVDATTESDTTKLLLSLAANESTADLGYRDFELNLHVELGRKLSMKLSFKNNSGEPVFIEDAFHSYFAVGDVREIEICGLDCTSYFDKTDGMKEKVQEEERLVLRCETDRPYFDTNRKITIEDRVWQRTIHIEKVNSLTTVVWNPWQTLTAKMADLDADEWKDFVCVESANALKNKVRIESGSVHTLETTISLT